MMILGVLGGEKTNPIQSQTNPIRVSPQTCAGGLKKQSQFANGQNGVKYYMKGYYGNMSPWRARKNKANQSQSTALFELVLNRVNLWKSHSRFLAVMSAEKRPAPTTLEVRPFKKVINYPASFSAGFTALSFNLLDISLHSSHRTTGRSGRAAAALRAIYRTARLWTRKRTRIIANAFSIAAGTARLRTARRTRRAGIVCRRHLGGHHFWARCRLGHHWAAGHTVLTGFCRRFVIGWFTVGITAKQNRPRHYSCYYTYNYNQILRILKTH